MHNLFKDTDLVTISPSPQLQSMCWYGVLVRYQQPSVLENIPHANFKRGRVYAASNYSSHRRSSVFIEKSWLGSLGIVIPNMWIGLIIISV